MLENTGKRTMMSENRKNTGKGKQCQKMKRKYRKKEKDVTKCRKMQEKGE